MKQLIGHLPEENIIFDLDGTLIDSASSILESFDIALKQCSIQPKVPLSLSLIGPPLIDVLEQLAGSSRAEVIVPLSAAFRKYYDEHGYKKSLCFDGVLELLEDLRDRGHRLFIATNKRALPTRRIVDNFHWQGYFSGVYSLDTFSPAARGKAELLRKIISINEFSSRECVYVGDRNEDATAAAQNSLRFVAAVWGYGYRSS
jgi:phosphoglycolate phosphatase